MMASGRFFGDGLINRFGRIRVMQISGIMISSGLFTAVFFPYLIPSTIAFMFVGLGVSTIVPTLYSIAGKHPTIPTGEALTAVSGVSFLGFLMGPPVIGYIAELSSLRFSFAFIGIFGFMIALMVARIKGIE
jgi:MFS family permease